MTSDEDRWSEARSLLDRKPSEPAGLRLRHRRRRLVLVTLAAMVLLGVPAGIVGARFAEGSSLSSPADVPTWQLVAGIVVAGVGLLVVLVAVVAQFRANRRMTVWSSPLFVLTGKQRKELLAVVRGRAPATPDRVPLARHLASNLLQQRASLGINLGLAVHWLGQTIAFPSWWRAALAGVFVLLTGVGAPLVRRQERQARRFLEQHPDTSLA